MSEGLFFFLHAFLKFYLFTNRHLSSSLIIGYNILPYILKGKREREREKKLKDKVHKKTTIDRFHCHATKK